MKKLLQMIEQKKRYTWSVMMLILLMGTALTVFRKHESNTAFSTVMVSSSDSLSATVWQNGGQNVSDLLEAMHQQSQAREIIRRDTIAEEDIQLMKNIDHSINNLIHDSH